MCKGAHLLGKWILVKVLWGRVSNPGLDSLKENLSCIKVVPQGWLQQTALGALSLRLDPESEAVQDQPSKNMSRHQSGKLEEWIEMYQFVTEYFQTQTTARIYHCYIKISLGTYAGP